MAKIAWYILFLVAFAVYSLLIRYVQKRQNQVLTSKKGKAFLANQLSMIVGLVPLVLIPWILTGFFSKWFLLALILAVEVASVFVYFSNRLAHVTTKQLGLRTALWMTEVTIKHPMVPLSMILWGLFVIFGYLIATSYFYFANLINSQEAIRGVLSVSMMMYLASMLFIGALTILRIASPIINNSIRRALFVAQAAYALPMGVVLTVYLGLMGFRSERFLPTTWALRSEFSQYLPLTVLIVFYLVMLIVPYFVGLEGRRQLEVSVYRDNVDRIRRVINVVGVPSDEDVNQLTQLRERLKEESNDWKSDQIIFEIVDRAKDSQADEGTRVILEAHAMFKDQDPRYINLSAMEELDQDLQEMIAEYKRIAQGGHRIHLLLELSRSLEAHFKDKKTDYENRMKAAEDTKVLTPVLARLVAVIGATPVILQYGQRLIELLPIGQ